MGYRHLRLSQIEIERLWGTKEPTVITHPLLRAAVYSQGPKEEAGKIARIEGIDFATVLDLSLNFQNILRIGNLGEFLNLTKLQLDNNIIEKIENLDNLINLTWLDLSFNRIEKIENLDGLKKLEDVSLFNNQIRRIEGLDSLDQLKYLSLGRNLIDELENITYLRQFRRLNSLTLEGNPLTNTPNYRPYVCAFLAKLQYLDYKGISEDMRHTAYLQYQIPVDQMTEKMREEDQREMQRLEELSNGQQYAQAFVDDVYGDALFQSISRADVEGNKFLPLPLVGEVVEQFREKLAESCRMIFQFGLEEFAKRQMEESCFRESIREVKVADRAEGIKLIKDFVEYKIKTLHRLESIHEAQTSVMEEVVTGYREKVHELWEQLMANEMVISEQIEEVSTEFGRNMLEMMSYFLEIIQNYFSKCREAAVNSHERLIEATLPYAERLTKSDATELEQLLFPDRESMTNALMQSKDNQSLQIDQCEERISSRANAWCKQLIDDLHEKEIIQRHLDRVTEINLFIDSQRAELDSFDLGGI